MIIAQVYLFYAVTPDRENHVENSVLYDMLLFHKLFLSIKYKLDANICIFYFRSEVQFLSFTL